MKFTKEDFYNQMYFTINGYTDIYRYDGLVLRKIGEDGFLNFYCTLGRVTKQMFEAYTTFINRPIMTVVLFKDCQHYNED